MRQHRPPVRQGLEPKSFGLFGENVAKQPLKAKVAIRDGSDFALERVAAARSLREINGVEAGNRPGSRGKNAIGSVRRSRCNS
jgi:hypothetical protein